MEDLVDVDFALHWRDDQITHCDRRIVAGVSPTSDHLGSTVLTPLLTAAPGATIMLAQGELLGTHHPAQHVHIATTDWPTQISGNTIAARRGRWFPQQVLAGKAGIAGQGPLRITAVGHGDIEIDLAPPLTGVHLTVEAMIRTRTRGDAGPPRDLQALLTTNGPGMQAALPGGCDFLTGDALTRLDEASDSHFYSKPRLVNHLDTSALTVLAALHRRFLRPGQRILDLMASGNSHFPEDAPDVEVTGLGMNTTELAANQRLRERVLHDLNVQPTLPFADRQFDLVLCALSVEYLIRPIEVFREVSRVLKPGCIFLVTFSERWFQPKAIKLWGELHPFERIGLTLDFFQSSAAFENMHSESMRGLPRPINDKYIKMTGLSDPIYAVWGVRKALHEMG